MLLALKDRFASAAVWAVRLMTFDQFPPPLAVTGVVTRQNGRGLEILLLRRSDGAWSLPGGMSRYGEGCMATALREVREETGYEVQIDRLAGVYSEPGRSQRFHAVVVVYACHPVGGSPHSTYEGIPIWVPVDSLPSPLFENDADIIHNCLTGLTHLG